MERLFSIILISTIAVFMALGAVLYSMGKDGLLLDSPQYDVIQTSFVMDEPKPKVVKKHEEPKPKPPPQKKVEDIPVDLTKQVKVEETPPPEPVRERQVRQVYGLKKVFSQGLGVGGESDDALVGKVGNTLDKDYDTLTAKADDFKGKPVANPQPQTPPQPAAITKRPSLKAGFRNLKPQYSKDMLQNRVEGIVKARILIGADGIIKQIEILEDIGYDSAEIAKAFLMTLQFEPAMRGEQAVSVWIPFSIKFELI